MSLVAMVSLFWQIREVPVAEDLPWWLTWLNPRGPYPPGDPGPEVYQFIAELPMEQQGTIVAAISAARGELEATRSKGLATIGAAVAAVSQKGAAKR
jgi:hypothetical protein